MIDDADVDSANPEILTVQEDQDGDEDDDVEMMMYLAGVKIRKYSIKMSPMV